jgi:hypothetical protein
LAVAFALPSKPTIATVSDPSTTAKTGPTWGALPGVEVGPGWAVGAVVPAWPQLATRRIRTASEARAFAFMTKV